MSSAFRKPNQLLGHNGYSKNNSFTYQCKEIQQKTWHDCSFFHTIWLQESSVALMHIQASLTLLDKKSTFSSPKSLLLVYSLEQSLQFKMTSRRSKIHLSITFCVSHSCVTRCTVSTWNTCTWFCISWLSKDKNTNKT